MDTFLFLPPELAMSTGTLTTEANAKTETQPLTVEKKKKWESVQSKSTSYCFFMLWSH